MLNLTKVAKSQTGQVGLVLFRAVSITALGFLTVIGNSIYHKIDTAVSVSDMKAALSARTELEDKANTAQWQAIQRLSDSVSINLKTQEVLTSNVLVLAEKATRQMETLKDHESRLRNVESKIPFFQIPTPGAR